MLENERENSRSGSGAGERTTGTLKALAERAPTRAVKAILKSIMIECREEVRITTAPGLRGRREELGGAAQRLRELDSAHLPFIHLG